MPQPSAQRAARTALRPFGTSGVRAHRRLGAAALLCVPVLLAVAGCGGGGVAADPTAESFRISPGASSVDTNCTGCNAATAHGAPVQQFKAEEVKAAALPDGSPAQITWTVSGGDPNSGPGSISASGQYTPPSYLTVDRAQVVVTATLNGASASGTGAVSSATATSVITVTPGFLQPLTPENAAVGAGGQLTFTGILAEAGGEDGISFALAGAANGSGAGQGSLSTPNCQRTARAYTACTVTYTAPASVQASGATYIVATATGSESKTAAEVLVNIAGVSSNPATHQAQQLSPALLGTSGGNDVDYDSVGAQVADCCGGTLGSLIQDSSGRQYLLSNNHVLARSDQASEGDMIVQPGLIDNNCSPYGDGPGTTPVASLTGWLPLSAASTNADAAIALMAPGGMDPAGSIAELGARQVDGTLAAAPPGVSSTGGKGEAAALGQMVAKSGRTTGLTCGSVSALDLDVKVDYFGDCAETRPYLSKTFTNQVAVSGNQFSDAGDSGSLIVDSANAEPVGLYFAGGMDAAGVSQGVASPATDVLAELSAHVGNGGSYSFVGAADHGVACLNYGDNTVSAAQSRQLTDAETARVQQGLAQARLLINPSAGVLGVAMGKSSDHAGEGAVVVYVDEAMNPAVPALVEGVRTVVIPTNARAVALGSVPQTPLEAGSGSVPAAAFNQALGVKQRLARSLMAQNSAFFGVGVGQSLDNLSEPSLVIYVDRKAAPVQLAEIVGGLRARYILMDRLHVTRSYATSVASRPRCLARGTVPAPEGYDPLSRGSGLGDSGLHDSGLRDSGLRDSSLKLP